MDFAEANDLSAKNPEKLKELIALWEVEAKKYNVFPLDDRRYERVMKPLSNRRCKENARLNDSPPGLSPPNARPSRWAERRASGVGHTRT